MDRHGLAADCLQDCLALGVIFAATDSVAVLQVLKQDRSPLLYSLVFGEGVINDATAVALLRAVQVLHPLLQPLRLNITCALCQVPGPTGKCKVQTAFLILSGLGAESPLVASAPINGHACCALEVVKADWQAQCTHSVSDLLRAHSRQASGCFSSYPDL